MLKLSKPYLLHTYMPIPVNTLSPTSFQSLLK